MVTSQIDGIYIGFVFLMLMVASVGLLPVMLYLRTCRRSKEEQLRELCQGKIHSDIDDTPF